MAEDYRLPAYFSKEIRESKCDSNFFTKKFDILGKMCYVIIVVGKVFPVIKNDRGVYPRKCVFILGGK